MDNSEPMQSESTIEPPDSRNCPGGFVFTGDFVKMQKGFVLTRDNVTIWNNKPAGRVPPDALLFVQTATKSRQKMPLSCGGHLPLPSSADQFFVDVLTRALLLGTKGGARIYCSGPTVKIDEFPLSASIISPPPASSRGPGNKFGHPLSGVKKTALVHLANGLWISRKVGNRNAERSA